MKALTAAVNTDLVYRLGCMSDMVNTVNRPIKSLYIQRCVFYFCRLVNGDGAACLCAPQPACTRLRYRLAYKLSTRVRASCEVGNMFCCFFSPSRPRLPEP